MGADQRRHVILGRHCSRQPARTCSIRSAHLEPRACAGRDARILGRGGPPLGRRSFVDREAAARPSLTRIDTSNCASCGVNAQGSMRSMYLTIFWAAWRLRAAIQRRETCSQSDVCVVRRASIPQTYSARSGPFFPGHRLDGIHSDHGRREPRLRGCGACPRP
jgi:hypothetical protein